MKNKRLVLLAVIFMMSIGTFTRIEGNESIRAIQFVSIFTIGALAALLIKEIAETFKKRS